MFVPPSPDMSPLKILRENIDMLDRQWTRSVKENHCITFEERRHFQTWRACKWVSSKPPHRSQEWVRRLACENISPLLYCLRNLNLETGFEPRVEDCSIWLDSRFCVRSTIEPVKACTNLNIKELAFVIKSK